jgi:hypothetical protein
MLILVLLELGCYQVCASDSYQERVFTNPFTVYLSWLTGASSDDSYSREFLALFWCKLPTHKEAQSDIKKFLAELFREKFNKTINEQSCDRLSKPSEPDGRSCQVQTGNIAALINSFAESYRNLADALTWSLETVHLAEISGSGGLKRRANATLELAFRSHKKTLATVKAKLSEYNISADLENESLDAFVEQQIRPR